MARDWETQFHVWAQPPGKAEQDKMERAEVEIRAAIAASPKIGTHDVRTFPTGSYKNRTHVPRESDVDICVMYKDVFFSSWQFVDSTASSDSTVRERLLEEAGLTSATYRYAEFKNDVEAALVARFGRAAVERGDKAFDVYETSSKVESDVLAAFEHRRWSRNAYGQLSYISGTEFVSDSGKRIVNWPDQQYDNGVNKHAATHDRFKKMVRILKNLRNEMDDGGNKAAGPIPSFLSECLVWNVPDSDFGRATYYDDMREVLRFVYLGTRTEPECREWAEENDLKYLIRASQAWTREEVNNFALAAWQHVGFAG
jgi:hypothetical protein